MGSRIQSQVIKWHSLGSSVQFSRSVVSDSLRPHELNAAHQASLSIANSRSSLKLTSIESVMPSNHLIFYRPLLLPPIPPGIRVFSNESALLMKWPKYWSFSFSIIPSKALGSNKAEDVCILRPSHPTPKYTPSRNMYICSSKLRCKNWSKQH